MSMAGKKPWWADKNADKSSVQPRGRGYRIGDTISMPGRLLSTVVAGIGLAVVAFVSFGVVGGNNSYAMNGPYGSTVNLPNTSAVMSACGSIYQFKPTLGYGVFDEEEVIAATEKATDGKVSRLRIPTAPMLVPAYGYMSEDKIPEGRTFYSKSDSDLPPLHVTLRSMYDGRVVLWYLPEDTTDNTLENLREWAKDYPEVVIIPWATATLGIPDNLQGHTMPENRSIAFSAWNVTQSCGVFNEDAADGFMDFLEEINHSNLLPGEPPYAGVNEDGRLPNIPFQGSDIT